MKLSVVVPVRNEAENIDPLLAEIHAALDGRVDFEVVYVDDGSDDGTAATLAAARQRYPRLRVVRHRTACGQSAAIATGVKAAQGAWIATLDGDGQNDPADIPKLWAMLDADGAADPKRVIIGHRKKRRDTLAKRIASRLANKIRASLLNDNTPDTGCGLKLFARETFLDLPRFDHMHRYLPALFLKRGCTVTSVAVNHRPRERGVSKYGVLDRLWVGISDLMGVMWLQRRTSVPVIVPED
ncbi:MAG: glycosyltransferase family 2 protein [Candidatus Eiseniibacteriota bacterium]